MLRTIEGTGFVWLATRHKCSSRAVAGADMFILIGPCRKVLSGDLYTGDFFFSPSVLDQAVKFNACCKYCCRPSPYGFRHDPVRRFAKISFLVGADSRCVVFVHV